MRAPTRLRLRKEPEHRLHQAWVSSSGWRKVGACWPLKFPKALRQPWVPDHGLPLEWRPSWLPWKACECFPRPQSQTCRCRSTKGPCQLSPRFRRGSKEQASLPRQSATYCGHSPGRSEVPRSGSTSRAGCPRWSRWPAVPVPRSLLPLNACEYWTRQGFQVNPRRPVTTGCVRQGQGLSPRQTEARALRLQRKPPKCLGRRKSPERRLPLERLQPRCQGKVGERRSRLEPSSC